jgi:hypothetical protein
MKEYIIGARNFKSITFSLVLLFAGLGFFTAGLYSYLKINITYFTDISTLKFVPQGLTMLFYGTIALVISFYNLLTIIWDVGSGYNELSLKDEKINIVRRGFPGINRKLFFSYEFRNIKKIKFLIKQGFNPRNNVILVLNDRREIPLFPAHFLENPIEMEKKAIKWASLLNIPLENAVA